MATFTLHDKQTAPEQSKALLDSSLKTFGMIPGLHAVMAESPQVLEGYQKLHELILASSFDNNETTVVWQSINVEHACHYCVPAHTGIAKAMGVSDDITNALRNETPLADGKLEALRAFTLAVVRKRGAVDSDEVQTFIDAGYTQRQVLEIILILSQKIMSNYINSIAETPVDAPFKKFDWTKNQ